MATFLLNTSILGGGRFVQRYTDEVVGEFRSVQYQFTENINNSDLEIHSFGAKLSLGSENTENT